MEIRFCLSLDNATKSDMCCKYLELPCNRVILNGRITSTFCKNLLFGTGTAYSLVLNQETILYACDEFL